MKVIILVLALAFSAFAEVEVKDNMLTKASSLFSEGRFEATVEELNRVEMILKETGKASAETQGLMSYWRAICFARLRSFSSALENFERSLKLKYAPQDIHYEYGQVLFVSERLREARHQFKESLKVGFKRGISLYYMAHISQEMGDRKTAFALYRKIQKLPPEESKEIIQAAEFQVGDIYLEQATDKKNDYQLIERIVVPQYEKAYELDKDSPLAPVIKQKITSLLKRYDLVLFQLRNGRPTQFPPYFLWIAGEYGHDSNVTFSPAETTIRKSRQSSLYAKTDMIGRYTFYHEDIMSISPELRFNATHYFNRVPEVYINDNFLIAPAVRTSYEHTLWNKPASFLLDYEYSEAHRDVNAEKNLEFSSRTHALVVGERFNYFKAGESTLRLRYRVLDSYINRSDSSTMSVNFEQIVPIKLNTLLIYSSFDMMRVQEESFDTNAFTLRGDLFMTPVRNWFTPSVGFAITTTDPINDRSNRGLEILINPSARISRAFGTNWRANLKYDYLKNNSKDADDFAFSKTITAFELEYLY